MKFIGGLVLFGLGLVRCCGVTLEELAADSKLWPAEVTISTATKVTQIRNGQPAGAMLVGAGKKITVTGIGPEGVTGKLGGNTVRVPAEKTDLLQRLDPAVAAAAPAEAAPAAPETEAPAAEAQPSAPSAMHRRLSGKLVQMTGGKLQPVPDARLQGVKYFGLYYSASWCGPCREFTPAFINTYRQIKKKYPQFEVVFISNDRSADDMRAYMKDDGMPWTALRFELNARNPELLRYAGNGIPCLVLVDAAGRVLSDSFDGDNYLGPGHVLQDTIRILEKGS